MVSGLLVLMLVMPVAASAQTLDVNSQIITLLQQIITLQKTLIETLQNQINQLSAQISSLNTTTQTHKCAIVTPPACATTLTATYDSNNCVTGYFCKPVTTSTTNTTAGASCTYNGQTYANGQTISEWCPGNMMEGLKLGSQCGGPMICASGQWVQWVSGAQSTGNSCTWVDGRTFPHGAKGFACTLFGSGCQLQTVAPPQWECRSGSWYMCDWQGNNCKNACDYYRSLGLPQSVIPNYCS